MRLLLFALCACATARPDPLGELNRIARADYADARARAVASAGPVLIAGPAKITLLDGGARRDFELAPPRYHALKSIAHLALGMHALWFQRTPAPAQVAELKDAATRALAALEGLTPDQLERQRRIVALAAQVDSAPALAAFEKAVAPLLLDNALDAARAEIADLDAAVAGLDVHRLHVIVVGAHMAREGEIAMQYFARLLGEPREGGRVVFAEGVWDEPGELALLGTHLLDASVGEAFFGDPFRMHRDLLSDAAAQVLRARGRSESPRSPAPAPQPEAR